MAKSYVKVVVSTLGCIAALSAILIADNSSYQHVLLLSVDGLHASDLAWYVGQHPTSPLGQLSASGRTYTNAKATMPSDSFPGLLAMRSEERRVGKECRSRGSAGHKKRIVPE